MTFMRKILDALNMDNWNGNSIIIRSILFVGRLFFSLQTTLFFLPFMIILSTLTDSNGNRISSTEYCSFCIFVYILIFFPINIVIRFFQSRKAKRSFIDFLTLSNYNSEKNNPLFSDDNKTGKISDSYPALTPQELEWIKSHYTYESPVNEDSSNKKLVTAFSSLEADQEAIMSSEKSHYTYEVPINEDSSYGKSVTASTPSKISQEVTISSEKNVKDHLNQDNMNNKHPKEKKVPISDAFLWQCNSIATLRDSDDIGYEYTNLDNPNDPLETGYRDALLDISDYNTLPLIDYSKDKYAPGGYIPRKLISWEHDFEECKNIFSDSNLPIITNLRSITRNINTMILQNPDGTIGRTVQEIFYCEIPLEYQNEYLQLIKMLNLALHDQEQFLISLSEIVFTRTANHTKYALPLSHISYNSEEHVFSYFFSNEVAFEENGGILYKSTETGSIIYAEDGTLKKATLRKEVENIAYTCRFKNYKSGFDLYDIRGNGQIIYKRNSK